MKIRPTKQQAIKAAINLTPQYADLLKDIQKGNGRITFSSEIFNIQNNLGKYVLIYDDERKIGRAFFQFLLGFEGYKDLEKELAEMSLEEQKNWVEELADNEEIVHSFDEFEIPHSSSEWDRAREALAALPENERKETEKQGVAFWSFIFSSFFNTLSLMIHGAKLTTLVPQALAGDDDAFLKAIQIDRMLLLHYPYFKERKFKAQDEQDREFLSKISYRENNPPVRGKIRYPALYMLFGVLDTYQWLDDITKVDILNACDEANLHRYQNRIEDETYLANRLRDYRRWQKFNCLSMR